MKILSICKAQAKDFWLVPEGVNVFKGGYIDDASIIYNTHIGDTVAVQGSSFIVARKLGYSTRYTLIDLVHNEVASDFVPACSSVEQLDIALKNAKGTLILIEESEDGSLAFFAVVK